MTDTNDANKKQRTGEAGIQMENFKDLVRAASLPIKDKALLLANIGPTGQVSPFALHFFRFGGVGDKMFLVPKEIENTVWTAKYDKSGHVAELVKGEVSIKDRELLMVTLSWNSYKKNDAWAFIMDGASVMGTIPRVAKFGVVEPGKEVDGVKQERKGHRVMCCSSGKVYYATEETLYDFMKLEFVAMKDLGRIADHVERAVVQGGYQQLKAAEFDTAEKIASKFANTSICAAVRDLAGLLLGFIQQGKSMDDKIEAFRSCPTVTFAAASSFHSLLTEARLVNVTTKQIVEKVSLADLRDTDEVITTQVSINQGYWDKLIDLEAIKVYRSVGNLAKWSENKKKPPASAQKFGSMSAKHAKAITAIICEENARDGTAAHPQPIADEQVEFDDDFFDL
jgi:hypothetical protein